MLLILNELYQFWQPLVQLWKQDPALVTSGLLNVILLVGLVVQHMRIWLLRRRIRRLRTGQLPTLGEWLRRVWRLIAPRFAIALQRLCVWLTAMREHLKQKSYELREAGFWSAGRKKQI